MHTVYFFEKKDVKPFSCMQQGVTFIELVIAIGVSAFLMLGLTMSFQNFSQYYTWFSHAIVYQQNLVSDVQNMETSLDGVRPMYVSLLDTHPFHESLYAYDASTMTTFVSTMSIDTETMISLSENTGVSAIHKQPLYVDMITVGTDIFFTDPGRHVIRRFNTVTLEDEIYAGGFGVAGYLDAAESSNARFRHPRGLAYFNGVIYVTDTGNHCVRTIVVDDNPLLRSVSTFAGNCGSSGNQQLTLLTSYFSYPTGIAINNDTGEVYVSDTDNHQIIRLGGGFVSRFIGTGFSGKTGDSSDVSLFSSFQLSFPTDLVVFDGMVYINDFMNKRVLRSSSLEVITVSDESIFYGDIGFAEVLGDDYILFSSLDGYKIYGMNTGTLQLQDVFEFSAYESLSYARKLKSLTSLDQDVYAITLERTSGEVSLDRYRFIDKTILSLYGSSSYYSSLLLFDVYNHVFSRFSDTISHTSWQKTELRKITPDRHMYEYLITSIPYGPSLDIVLDSSFIFGQ